MMEENTRAQKREQKQLSSTPVGRIAEQKMARRSVYAGVADAQRSVMERFGDWRGLGLGLLMSVGLQ